MSPRAELTADLERALLRELLREWEQIDYTYFRRALRPPTLALHDGREQLGRWQRETRTLSLSREFVWEAHWSQVVEVLKHEVAHQYVHEVLRVLDEPAHGPLFQTVCAQYGFDGAASGVPDSNAGESPAVLRRIAKLLALADSPNQHEAEQAMRLAQRLMLEHNVASIAAASRRGYAFRQVGVPKARRSAADKLLGVILEEFFFVSVLSVSTYLAREGRRGSVLELCGTPSNLDVAVWVHDFLLATGERLWRAHKRAHGITSDRARREFLYGVLCGFREKLRAGVAQHRQDGLIWRGDPDLDRYFRRRNPRIVKGSGSFARVGEAYASGHAAGQTIVLSRPVGGSTSGGEQPPRLLPPSR